MVIINCFKKRLKRETIQSPGRKLCVMTSHSPAALVLNHMETPQSWGDLPRATENALSSPHIAIPLDDGRGGKNPSLRWFHEAWNSPMRAAQVSLDFP